jgi:5-carboxymethyl-2-hydroxymuconate isomerase
MGGRSVEQKTDLSRKIVQKLTIMFPHVNDMAINVRDFDRETKCNRDML